MIMAVRALSPSFPGGSLIEPLRYWIRNATRGEEGTGRRLVRSVSPTTGFGVDFIGWFSLGRAAPAGAAGVTPRSAASMHAGIAFAMTSAACRRLKTLSRPRRPRRPPPSLRCSPPSVCG